MTDQDEEVEIARVTMQWPQALKERVRDVAGGRAMTKYVIEAVEARLDGQEINDVQRKELWDARYLCQQLADALAMAGDYEDRISVLRSMDLPAWIETSGWADEAAEVVPVESAPELPEIHPDDLRKEAWGDPGDPGEREHVQATEMGSEAWAAEEAREAREHAAAIGADYGREEAAKEPPAPGETVAISGEPKTGRSHSSDLFQRLREAAAAKGVDVSGIDLKPASEVEVLTDEERAAKGVQLAQHRAEAIQAAAGSEPEVEADIDPGRIGRSDIDVTGMVDQHGEAITGVGTPPTGKVVDDDEHNHAWAPLEDPHGIYSGKAHVCDCGASMDSVRVYEFGEVPEPKEPTVEPTEAPETAPNRCSSCQDELIDGECWTCM